MPVSANDGLSAVNTIYTIVCKVALLRSQQLIRPHSFGDEVKENKTELLRLCNRISHVLLSLEDVKNRDIIRDTEYNDALAVISEFVVPLKTFDDSCRHFSVILRTERISQRLLKRSLGDRTWNRAEIAAEINRLNEDLKNYMGAHTVNALLILVSMNITNNS